MSNISYLYYCFFEISAHLHDEGNLLWVNGFICVQMSVVLALSAEAVRGWQRKNVPGLASATPGTFCVYFVNSNHFDVRGYQRIS